MPCSPGTAKLKNAQKNEKSCVDLVCQEQLLIYKISSNNGNHGNKKQHQESSDRKEENENNKHKSMCFICSEVNSVKTLFYLYHVANKKICDLTTKTKPEVLLLIPVPN